MHKYSIPVLHNNGTFCQYKTTFHVSGMEKISFRSAKDALPATAYLGRKRTEIHNQLESLLFALYF